MKVALPVGVSRLDRYLLSEMALPFLFGVGAFVSLVMTIGSFFELVRLMVESGLPLETAARIFGLRLWGFIVLTFPMSMLLTALLAYSRLSADSEIVALKACGVSASRLIAPALVMSLCVTALTFVFNEQIVPSANYEANVTLARALNQDAPSFKRSNITYQEFEDRQGPDGNFSRQLARILYAKNYDEGVLQEMTVLDFTQDNLTQIVKAQRGTWLPKQQKWLFEQGRIYTIDSAGSYRNILQFDKQQVNISHRPIDWIEGSKRRPEEMTIRELGRFIQLSADAGQDTRSLWVQYYQKFSFPFVCVAFALVGATLGMRPQRTTRAVGLGLCILIIFGYYVFSVLAGAWGQLGYLTPIVAAWLPIFVTVGVGGILLWRVSR
ncbi:LptF/LptG family permease [Anthocerotibacter panamensis]|uniref:LptF/LptG family permease n=1 Tax=Anthocerotibacter panamensis TaxID=2857077 RepID=UPI001FDA8D70|nr:LptF/LptG family permease [Anthocerotibacter panamensis]